MVVRHLHLRRNEDPWTSHVAAAAISPHLDRRTQEVLDRLLAANGGWVDGHELATVECGGSEGKRRARGLRKLGYIVKCRIHPTHGRTTWQYRLIVPGKKVKRTLRVR